MLDVDKLIELVEEEGRSGMSEVLPIKIKMKSPEHGNNFFKGSKNFFVKNFKNF